MPDITKFGPQINENRPSGFCIIHVELDENGEACDWTFLHANEEMARFDRVPLDRLIGARFYELFPRADRKWLRFFWRAAYNGESMCIDDVAEGKGFYLHVEAYPTGQPGCCAAVFSDFKTQVQEQERMLTLYERERDTSRRVRSYAKSLGVAFPEIICLDYKNDYYVVQDYDRLISAATLPHGNIDALVHKTASAVPDEALSKRFEELFCRKNAIKAFEEGARIISLHHPQVGEDGVLHHVETRLICTDYTDTDIKCMAVEEIVDDEYERDTALLRAQEGDADVAALSNAYATIVVTDLATRTTRTLKAEHPATSFIDTKDEQQHDENAAALLEMFVVPEERERMRAFLDLDTLPERMRGTDSVSMEFPAQNGRYYLGRYIARSRDASGRVTVVLFAARDITEEKSRELDLIERLRAAVQEADNANLSKTNFLRRMSHDIRTPLNGIIGMLRLMQKTEGDPDRYHECMDKITRSTDYLLDIVNNVLDVSKMESGEIELEHKPFNITELLHNIISIVATNASQNSVLFVGGENIDVRHSYVIGSPVHINRVIMNVASNAIKYNRAGGTLSISCRETKSDGKQAEYEIVCSDTGLGMSEEFQKHAFDPYTREGKPTTTSFSGSGLGLSIVRKIVTTMGGTIELESRENVGTTVRITLSLTLDETGKKRAGRDEGPGEEHIDLRGYHALLVEDNEINTEIARLLLEDLGLEVDTAENGKVAVDKFAGADSFTYDFVFMDMMMPVMDGLEATRAIRALPNADAASVPIIAMTANAFAEDRQACLDAGMNDHIGKPISSRDIVTALKKFVKG